MKDALQYIITAIVDKPDLVKIEESQEEEGALLYTVTVAPEDMGKVIGKEGKVIRAIRNIMKIPAIKNNKKIQVTLAEA